VVIKQVLFLISSLGPGGAERQTIDLINRLDRNRFTVSLAYFVRDETLKPLLKEDRLAGLHCLDKRMRFDLGALIRLKAIVQNTKPDIVVCVNLYPAIYAHLLRLSGRHNCKLAVVMHSTIMRNRYIDVLVKLLYRFLLNRSDSVIFVCCNQMKYWQTKYKIKEEICHYIYNGVDTEKFICQMEKRERVNFRNSLGIKENETVVSICATLLPAKRHVDLIDAGELLRKQGFQLKILIVGDGPERNIIQRHIKAKQMDDIVILAGFQPDVRLFVNIADVFTLCSSTETFSIAVLEAMAMGKPVVAPATGGISEQVLNGKNGLLFPTGNIKELAKSLAAIISSGSGKSMGEISRTLVKEKFAVEKMVAEYECILESI
jgi:glycosyltransferase involved in cell wall biosynthesis